MPVRRKLKEMQALIREEAPGAHEKISYGIAAFILHGPLVYIAGFKNHVSFFPTSSGVKAFKKELKDYKTSTGTIQFKLDEPLPLELLRKIVRFRLAETREEKTGRSVSIRKKGAKSEGRLILRFRSVLERLAPDSNYFAFEVPLKISREVGIRKTVPVIAEVNGSESFRGSLFPVGEGRHFMRVKEKIRTQVGIQEGDSAEIKITVLSSDAKNALPKEFSDVIKEAGLKEAFDLLPPGRRNYLIRWVSEAARVETRQKRIEQALLESRSRAAKRK